MKIYGVVVLYNPDYTILDNIKSYIDGIEKLYVVDNSETKNHELINKIVIISEKCIYIDNNGNQGIAHALNVGAKLAIENGADWLLTMDQDSKFEDGGLRNMINYIQRPNILEITGIISPIHLTNGKNHIIKESVSEVITVMTSGNLLNLKAFQQIGEFKENYFIDYVDHEYCLRLNKNKYKILVMNNIILHHSLGNISVHKIFGYNIKCTNHSYLRRYYIMRNRLDVIFSYINEYPKFCLNEIKSIIIGILKIVLFEQNKVLKFKYMFYGFRDFMSNKFGNFNEN